jgi:hypothetical protein
MKAFCAVAPIPRQEDFGLADAVATLLRLENKFWYAEDSFLIQFKSRTEAKLPLHAPVFSRWIAQDLSVILGRVNLVEKTIELFTLGSALFDRRLHEATGLVAWLRECDEGVYDGILHLKLEKPILKWSVQETESTEFTEHTYMILKQWLHLERWNRRYFRAGVAREIKWETNSLPVEGEIVHVWSPEHAREALADIEPLVHLIGLHSRYHPELWTRVHAMEASLRGPDESGVFASRNPYEQLFAILPRLRVLLEKHPTADAVVTVQVLHLDAKGANLWVHSVARGGTGTSNRHQGSWSELNEKGFDHEIVGVSPNSNVTLKFDRHFANKPIPHEIFDGPADSALVDLGDHSPCYFLRRSPSDGRASDTSPSHGTT